ncbi:hypothetical protein GIB67_031348 [Kingdonia uniflora]|uniref:Uncharacterized protein n=1 Tax=Kingdonia uniflora TaxID=39325 RepID=A0A7J7MGU4_9MAGN|nr:hypothetical protein GIB67_031348 [Kingdonia uniflora]
MQLVLVHELQDDFGKGGHELSLSTGNASRRLACGLQSSFPASSMNFNDQRSSAVFGLQHENHFDKSSKRGETLGLLSTLSCNHGEGIEETFEDAQDTKAYDP